MARGVDVDGEVRPGAFSRVECLSWYVRIVREGNPGTISGGLGPHGDWDNVMSYIVSLFWHGKKKTFDARYLSVPLRIHARPQRGRGTSPIRQDAADGTPRQGLFATRRHTPHPSRRGSRRPWKGHWCSPFFGDFRWLGRSGRRHRNSRRWCPRGWAPPSQSSTR